MRNREVIEREMHHAREDLEQSLSELRHVVQEKIDVKARARVAVEKGKQAAEEALVRGLAQAKFFAQKGKYEAQQLASKGKDGAVHLAARGRDGARDLYVRGRGTVEERPVLIASIAAGVIAAGVFIYIARKKNWFRSSV